MGDWTSANGRLGAAAEWYANNGWYVLPVHGIDRDGKCTCGKSHTDPKEIGKHPASPKGQTDATQDIEQIRRWWTENPDYNIGVFAKPSGFLVVDIDPRSGGDDAFLKLEELAEGNIPTTVEAITGEYYVKNQTIRGRHLIYECDPNEKFIGNFKKAGLDGIDIKHAGYILVTPSRHFSGVTYEWKEGQAPWNIKPTKAPEELLSVLRARGLRTVGGGGTDYGTTDWNFLADLKYSDKMDIDSVLRDGVDEGSRATTLYQLACGLANKHGTDVSGRAAVEALMLKFNAEMVRPPMEIEGQNSILMHTRRALDFVANNPKIDFMYPGLSDWAKTRGTDWAKNAAHTFLDASPSPVVDSDLELEAISKFPIANAVGSQMEALAADGQGLHQSALAGKLDLPNDPDSLSAEAGGTPGRRSLTDVGNGRRLVDSFGSSLRYTTSVGWFVWDGHYWKPDVEKILIREVSKMVSSVVASEVAQLAMDDPRAPELVKWANQAKSNGRINNMIEQGTTDTRIQVSVDQWDSNPYLLGVANGVIDLKNGELLKGKPELNITRRSPIAYLPGLKNHRWETFINEVTKGDKELQDWLQKAIGYTLTGLNNQDVLFLVYGPPGSGKNTFVETIYEAIGRTEYAWALDSQVLALGDRMSSTDEYHMAELRGRRMIWVDELPENERIKENQVKKLTGSGTLQGRSPGEKPITFVSQGKLWVTTNHRPIITDEAMWRRLRPIPLGNVPEKPDPSLKSYLADPDGGLPAVLAWAVEGAVKYLSSSAADPLGWCTAVSEAQAIYRKNEDRIGAFLEEETREDPDASAKLVDIYRSYKAWSDSRGERPLSQIGFQRKLADRGLEILGHGNRALVKGRATLLYEVGILPVVDFAKQANYSTSF